MGMNWESALVVGFVIDRDDLEMPFKQDVPEETHLEDRYDARTGKKVGQVTVVDKEAREEYFLNDSSLGDDSGELIEALEQEVGCSIVLHGDHCTGEDMVYAVEPKYKTTDGGLTIKQVADLQSECERIRGAFKKKYGVDLGDAVVTTVMDYA